MQRRTFISASMGALGSVFFSPLLEAATIYKGWLNGFKDDQGRYGIAYIDESFNATPLVYTPIRLHGITKHPTKADIVAPARRPDMQMFVFDMERKALRIIQSDKGRHFYGHGVYSTDGKLFYTTQNAYDEEKGVIGVYDVDQGYKKITEWDSGGIGPHELRLYKNQLIIANGGILTHPDMGRAKLNIDSMAPNLTYLDLETGQINNQLSLPQDLLQLSIRHMDVTQNGTVFVGLQDQLEHRRNLPLVWKTQSGKLQEMTQPTQGWRIFNGYVGSVCTNQNGLCVSSPRGNVIHLWGQKMKALAQKDVCGLAPCGKSDFLITTGGGTIMNFSHNGPLSALHFDNHCTAI